LCFRSFSDDPKEGAVGRSSDASERSRNFFPLLKGDITGDVSTVEGLSSSALQTAMCPDVHNLLG